MKFLTAFFLFFSLTTNAQQDNFLKIPSHGNNLNGPAFSSFLEEIFKDSTSPTAICIDVEELAKAPLYDFSKLTEVELVEIKFTLSPSSSDSTKKVFIDSINVLMKNMKYFAKCPKLKKVVFCIGEQVYLTKEESVNEEYDERIRKWQFEQNQKNAWLAFGKDVSVLLPGVKLYAFSWGW
jgi:hypothetical protein